MSDYKPRINLDFDGVITASSPSATGKIAPLRTGTRKFLDSLRKRGYLIYVMTAHQPLGEVREFLRSHSLLPLLEGVGNEKRPAVIQLDDRAVTFNGNWEDSIKQIDSFRPHWELGTKHKFSCVMCPMPEEVYGDLEKISAALRDEDLDPEDGRETDFHITLKYGLESDRPDGVLRALGEMGPIRITLKKLSLFVLPDKEVLKFDVESQDAMNANAAICKECPHVDTYASYIPHLTIGCLKPGMGEKYVNPRSLDGKDLVLPSAIFADRNGNTETISLRAREAAAAK